MTDHEKAVVMAYTGVTMLKGEKFQVFHNYVEDLLGRPVFTHELANDATCSEIKEKSKADFLELCREDKQEKQNETVLQQWEKMLTADDVLLFVRRYPRTIRDFPFPCMEYRDVDTRFYFRRKGSVFKCREFRD